LTRHALQQEAKPDRGLLFRRVVFCLGQLCDIERNAPTQRPAEPVSGLVGLYRLNLGFEETKQAIKRKSCCSFSSEVDICTTPVEPFSLYRVHVSITTADKQKLNRHIVATEAVLKNEGVALILYGPCPIY
jgi:hypothetical protein